jgi:hypothetical protein
VKATDKVYDSKQTGGTGGDHDESLQQAWDDISGALLDSREVKKARMLEMKYAKEKRVWCKIPRSTAMRNGWKIIKTKWIDINKGDVDNPIYRSRFVGKEFNTHEVEGLFAGTPPLEALRLLLSQAATTTQHEKMNQKIVMINDVSRAFFEAPMQVGRHLCIELPEEDCTEEDKRRDMVGYLTKSLYGTRDAAYNFQKEVSTKLKQCGFTQGKYNPCTYHHKARGLICMVHGDDFVTVGSREDCKWFKRKLEERFDIKTKLIGCGPQEVREDRILNRIIRVTEKGWELEADQRHVDILVEQLNLKDAKGVSTPAEDEKRWDEDENREELNGKEARQYRELAARANYLAQDRVDIQFATKEICRGMCTPRRGDLKKLRRLARYLLTVPRAVVKYYWQRPVECITAFTDSDFAGCRVTAKSTSGGVLLAGAHYLKSWSSTQKTIALSSGEAELTALVKCSCEAIGIVQLAADWCLTYEAEIFVDSSAALGVVGRKGAGKLRHVRVGQLWVQERAESGDLRYRKVRGTENPADMLTKTLSAPEITRYMQDLAWEKCEGRAERSLGLCSLVVSNRLFKDSSAYVYHTSSAAHRPVASGRGGVLT